jgi:23S rRNA pseudouridine1911/1915/1917 synthase
MSEETVSVEVPALLGGVRVDRGVAMVADVSRSLAAGLVAAGRVQVDGTVVTSGKSLLTEGALLTVQVPDPSEGGVAADDDVAFAVVYADEALAVVNKPAGLVVHPGAGQHEGTLVGGLLSAFPELADLVTLGLCPPDRPGIVHRLDKGTSGLMVVARTPAAYEALVGQLASRTMERHYLALVEGTVEDSQGEVDAPIGRSARTPTKMAITARGKPARTRYTVLERRSGPHVTTLLELKLQSGRTHQIRVHMAAIGHPVVGDARYGKPEKALGAGRFFLHAFRLALDHPGSGERLEFTQGLPSDLAGYLEGEGQPAGPEAVPQ